MSEYLLILVRTILVNNFVLVQFLGLCPFMGVSSKLESAIGMSAATTFVLTLASICSYLTHTYLLEPLGLEYLKTISFILVIAVVVQFTEMAVRKMSPMLHKVLGVFLPLITTNCAVLGVALLNINKTHNFIESAIYGFGAAVGFSLVLVLFAAFALYDIKLVSGWVNTGFAASTKYFGAYWQVLLLLTFVIGLVLTIGRTGSVVLGNLARPEMSTFKWISIIMCTLLAGGGVFWAAAEPMAHFTSPPPLFGGETGTASAAYNALAQSFMHWGFLAWAILGSLTGVVFMYLHYEKGLPLAPRTLLYPVFGDKAIHGPIGQNVSKDLPRYHCWCCFCTSRAVTSLMMVNPKTASQADSASTTEPGGTDRPTITPSSPS